MGDNQDLQKGRKGREGRQRRLLRSQQGLWLSVLNSILEPLLSTAVVPTVLCPLRLLTCGCWVVKGLWGDRTGVLDNSWFILLMTSSMMSCLSSTWCSPISGMLQSMTWWKMWPR
jgi:hypothetical protein